MSTKILLLIFLFVIPAFAFGVGNSVGKDYESEWSTLLKQQGVGPENMKDFLGLSEFCAIPERRETLSIQCDLYGAATFLKHSSVPTAAGGLLLVALIGLAGYLARSSRKLLLTLFRPGLYITVLASIFLVIMHASLAIGAIYVGSMFYGGFIFLLVLGSIAITAFAACVGMILGLISVFKPMITNVFGKKVSQDEQPGLYKFVADLAAEINALPPDHIVVGLDPNFFVTQGKVECHDRRLWGRTLYLSLPLCRILSHEEFQSVLGHELGHFKGLDTEYGRKFAPIYRAAHECLLHLGEQMVWPRAVALFPAYYCLAYFFESFAVAESKSSRERELAADRVGADVSGRTNAGTALIKVHAFQDFWEWFRQGLRDSLATDKPFTNGSSMFAEGVRANWEKPVFDGLEERDTPHPTNSHPTLRVRLEALGLSLPDLIDHDQVALPDSPAIELLANYEKIEEDLTDLKRKSMVRTRELPTGKRCPACTRENPFTAELCECGFNFLRMPVG